MNPLALWLLIFVGVSLVTVLAINSDHSRTEAKCASHHMRSAGSMCRDSENRLFAPIDWE